MKSEMKGKVIIVDYTKQKIVRSWIDQSYTNTCVFLKELSKFLTHIKPMKIKC